MQHKRKLDPAALDRGVHPRPGRDFAFVATIPADDGIDIVGAAQYVRALEDDPTTCEFAITVAEDWRGSGLARELLASLVRRARRDGYTRIEGCGDRGQLEDAGAVAQARVQVAPRARRRGRGSGGEGALGAMLHCRAMHRRRRR